MDYLRFFAPAVTGYLVSFLCPMEKTRVSVAQPPSWVFGVVWPILYAFIGYIWMRRRYDGLFGLLTSLTTLWLIVYSCPLHFSMPFINDRKKAGLFVFVCIIGVSFAIMATLSKHGNRVEIGMFAAFMAWILFAMMLNFSSVIQN